MINVVEFAERLKVIMNYYELSAAQFAEKLEVQRSSISHILSGRNKPSLDFVLKILKMFPGVELYWMLNGVGKFPENQKIETPPTLSREPVDEDEHVNAKEKISNLQSDEIERIVVFYKNGTFKNYTS